MTITARQIKRLREDRNMTQTEFAKLLGISRLAFHNLETGKSSFSARVRIELEKLLSTQESEGVVMSRFTLPIISVDPNLNDEDREFEAELISYFRLLDREARLKHLKSVARDVSMSAKSMLQKTMNRK